MRWWEKIKRWFSKEPVIDELPVIDQITYLLKRSERTSFKFDVKRSMDDQIVVYSKDVGMLRDWLDLAIATIENNDYVPDKWKRNPEKLKRMTFDDYLTIEDYVVYPIECEQWLVKKIDRLTILLKNPKANPHKIEYYQRQFSPILDDLINYLGAVIHCSM